jgi:hypothetical protein
MQISLYAEFDRSRLLSFLKKSVTFNLTDVISLFTQAYEVCEKLDLIQEMMYLLGKLGNKRQALFLIIDRLGDVSMVYFLLNIGD